MKREAEVGSIHSKSTRFNLTIPFAVGSKSITQLRRPAERAFFLRQMFGTCIPTPYVCSHPFSCRLVILIVCAELSVAIYTASNVLSNSDCTL
jgi:hypothetical protein